MLLDWIFLAIPGLILFWILVTYLEHLISLKNYPKGPFPLPLIGNLKLLSEEPWIDFIKLSKIYGDVFSFSFGKFHFSNFHQKSYRGKSKHRYVTFCRDVNSVL